MITAKVFQHGGSQAVRLPKAFRFDVSEVQVEKTKDGLLLTPVPARKFHSFSEIATHLASEFPEPESFPEPPPRPKKHERPPLDF